MMRVRQWILVRPKDRTIPDTGLESAQKVSVCLTCVCVDRLPQRSHLSFELSCIHPRTEPIVCTFMFKSVH